MAAPAQLARGTGRRKEAVCRVRLIEGTGTFKLNGRPLEDYFPNPAHRRLVTEPLRVTNTLERYDVLANLDGGGVSGQAGALRHGISRALCEFNTELRKRLKKAGFLTRDPRIKERKKYGQKGARRRFQFSKR